MKRPASGFVCQNISYSPSDHDPIILVLALIVIWNFSVTMDHFEATELMVVMMPFGFRVRDDPLEAKDIQPGRKEMQR